MNLRDRLKQAYRDLEAATERRKVAAKGDKLKLLKEKSTEIVYPKIPWYDWVWVKINKAKTVFGAKKETGSCSQDMQDLEYKSMAGRLDF